MLKSTIDMTFTVSMVTKMADIIFFGHICYHNNGKSKINVRILNLGNSSKKTNLMK